jgi:protocatechuate 3,4-dioxygenase beta subunit
MFKYVFLLVVLTAGVVGFVYFNETKPEAEKKSPPSTMDSQSSASGTPVVCGYTAEVTEGPYYVSGVPAVQNDNLNYDNLPGNTLTVSGYVYEGLDNSKPIANTVIDVWQTDAKGIYHPAGNGPFSKYTKDQVSLRGTVTTNADGRYVFETVYPGEYEGRARHIHVKVRAPGKKELTTQLILSLTGDAISFDKDTVSKGLPRCHLMSLNTSSPPNVAKFDFRLK